MKATDDNRQRAWGIVERCLRQVLPKGTVLPSDDADWIDTGLLDSMAHVELLSWLEKACQVTGMFDQTKAPTTIDAAVDAVEQALLARNERTDQSSNATVRNAPTPTALTGWSFAVGSLVIPSSEIEREYGLSAGTLSSGAGIETIARAAPDENILSLALSASNDALRNAALSPRDLGWIIATTETWLALPSLAASLHCSLLAPVSCRVLDVGGACVGLINASVVACALLADAPGRSGLVVSADVHSKVLMPGHAPGEFAGLFGDGASAFVIGPNPVGEKRARYKMHSHTSGCNGMHSTALRIRATEGGLTIQLDGKKLAAAAMAAMETTVTELEVITGITRTSAAAFAIHQPNPRLVEIFLRQADLPASKVPIVSKTRGNLGASTCGIALCLALDQLQHAEPATLQPIFLAAAGPGLLSAGAVLVASN